MLHYGNPDDFKWDVVTGISGGSINTGFLSVFEIGDEVEASEFMSSTYANFTNDHMWTEWPGGLLEGLLFEAGLFDNSPAVAFGQNIYRLFPDGYKRKFVLTANNADNGEYTQFTDRNTPYEDLINVIIASASVPVVFPPAHYNNSYYMDALTSWNINIDSAV